jgi:hypothetical protein
MKLKKILNLGAAIGFAFAIAFTVGCKKKPDITNTSGGNSDDNQIDASNLQVANDTEEKERDDFQLNIRALAAEGDFQSLESQAQDLRSNKSRFENGRWKLHAFYTAFGDYEKIGDDKSYSDLIGQLEKWAAGQPDSITPRLALVEAYHGYAWIARGSGTAKQITDQGEQLMAERVGKGFAWLREAQKLQDKAKDPAFYAITLHSFLGANVDRKIYESVFETGIQNAADYSALYEYKAYYLLPRWYGQEGEWETFARKMMQHTDIPNSEEIFARCALYLRDLGYFYDEFSASDDSWEDLKSSFHAIGKNYPDSLETKSILCLISIKLCDYKEGRAQMKLLNNKVDLGVWGSKDNFLAAAEWLNRDDASLESARQQFKAQRHQTN